MTFMRMDYERKFAQPIYREADIRVPNV